MLCLFLIGNVLCLKFKDLGFNPVPGFGPWIGLGLGIYNFNICILKKKKKLFSFSWTPYEMVFKAIFTAMHEFYILL